jgi:uncharacterized protein (DUF2141 family)
MIRIIMFMMISAFGNLLFGQAGKLTVQVEGFRNSEGKCLVYVYNNKEGFPTKPEKALIKIEEKITGNMSSAVIDGLIPGNYAIAVIHDENGNGKTDTNFLGIPREGMGASNNPKSVGPPSFSSSEFDLGNSPLTIMIKLKYL